MDTQETERDSEFAKWYSQNNWFYTDDSEPEAMMDWLRYNREKVLEFLGAK